MADTVTEIKTSEVKKGKIELPIYYRKGFTNFMEEAQKRDTEFTHYWVKWTSTKNLHMKKMKGWEPLTDSKEIERLGLKTLATGPNGTARWDDLELWRRPREVTDLVIQMHAEAVAERSASARAALDAVIHETKDRSRGAVRPFIDSGGTEDLATKKQVSEPK